jgi:UDP-2-acetamido-2,6-beta-L-arabino-hexul-4-ose reductase
VSHVLVTGAAGFIGRRVTDLLSDEGHDVSTFDLNDAASSLQAHAKNADFVFHFAGVNRTSNPRDFEQVNLGLTKILCDAIKEAGSGAVLVFASSTQALLDNHYGLSKRRAEQAIERFAKAGGRAVIFRLPNVFGPGCRPNYNSVVATFAHNTARDLPIEVHDPGRELSLVYVHDVAHAMAGVIELAPSAGAVQYSEVSPIGRITVQELADALSYYRQSRQSATVPTVSDAFSRKLYATYLSYLEPDDFGYSLVKRSDERGTLAEFLKSDSTGQLFMSRTDPGKIRGNHYHHTKVEKFFVVEGEAVIRFRRADGTGQVIEYPVNGADFRVVDIPPDYTHSIENVGLGQLVVLFWASEIFDPANPDTFTLNV